MKGQSSDMDGAGWQERIERMHPPRASAVDQVAKRIREDVFQLADGAFLGSRWSSLMGNAPSAKPIDGWCLYAKTIRV